MAEKSEPQETAGVLDKVGIIFTLILGFMGACPLSWIPDIIRIVVCVVVAICSGFCALVTKGKSENYRKAHIKANALRKIYWKQFTNVIGEIGIDVVETFDLFQEANQSIGNDIDSFSSIEGLVGRHGFGNHARSTCAHLTTLIASVTGCQNISVSIVWKTADSKNIITEAGARCSDKSDAQEKEYWGGKRPITDKEDAYFDQKYFYKYSKASALQSEPTIVVSNQKSITESKLKNTAGRWEQFIFVPILDSKKNLVGLIELFSEAGYFLSKEKKDSKLEELAKMYITPFNDVFLLWDSLRKNLIESKVKEVLQNGR